MHLKYTYFIFSVFLFFNSCKENKNPVGNKNPLYTIINLKSVVDQEFSFDFIYTDFPIYPYSKKYPEYYKMKVERMVGVPKLDSFMIVTRNFQLTPFSYNLYKKGYIDKSEFSKKSGGKSLDYFSNMPDSLNFQINVLSGFLGENQIIIPDINANNDFGDDESYRFNRYFRINHNNNPDIINQIPILDYSYQVYFNQNVHKIRRRIQLYPYSNHPFHTYFLNNKIVDSVTNKYTLMLRFKNYFKGSLQVDNVLYNIAVQGISKKHHQIVIIPDSLRNRQRMLSTRANYRYSNKDSISLGKNIFRIDSISGNLSQIFFKKLKIDIDDYRGNRTGDRIKNYSLTNLKKENKKILDIIESDKQFTLLDFWGTWCTPCIELIPELKKLHRKHAEDVNFISIALDEDVEVVEKFTKDYNMNWPHFFVDRGDREGTIIRGLDIGSYPTFILLDENLKIIFRGGSSSFKNIPKMIENLIGQE